MRYLAIVVTIAITFLCSFNAKSFAGVLLVDSDTDSLDIITHTKYLDNNPVLIFSAQQKKEVIKVLEGIDNFVFKDSSWQDLAIELITKENETTINKEGIYEIYARMSEVSKETSDFEINIDGAEWRPYTGSQMLDNGRKFIKVVEKYLKEGERVVTAFQISDYSEISEKNLKLVLVNKKERKSIEKIIWQKINQPGIGFCYIFKEEKGKFYVP